MTIQKTIQKYLLIHMVVCILCKYICIFNHCVVMELPRYHKFVSVNILLCLNNLNLTLLKWIYFWHYQKFKMEKWKLNIET